MTKGLKKDKGEKGKPSQKEDQKQNQAERKQEPVFVPAPPIATQGAVEGIRFDFNYGLRVSFPNNEEKYRCVFYDADTDILLYSADMPPGACVTSVKKYYIRFCLEIYKGKEKIFSHLMDLKDKDVLLQFPVGAIGDTIAWFSNVPAFQKKHGCKLTVSMDPKLSVLFKDQYPEINFITRAQVEQQQPYATYNLGLYFQNDVDHQQFDFRQIGLHKTVGEILGMHDLPEEPPKVNLSATRIIPEKYVCRHCGRQYNRYNCFVDSGFCAYRLLYCP